MAPRRENIVSYLSVLMGYVLEMANSAHLHKDDWARTIFIDTGGVRATQFGLSNAEIAMLRQNGADGVTAYLQWFNNPNEQPYNRV